MGIARALENKEKTLNATIAYTARYAPRETIEDSVTSYASDIWSLGLVFYELSVAKRVWEEYSSNKIIISLHSEVSPFTDINWE